MDYTWHYDSPLGGITMASDGTALVGLWFDGQRHFAATLDIRHKERMLPVFHDTEKWLNYYFSGKAPGFTPKLNLRASDFRKSVLEILLGIPFGKTMTYGEIAAIIAHKRSPSRMSSQAVGGAVGRNPISIIIPCHRVVGIDGSLTGYAGGLDRKQKLLELESLKP